jgi:hypothetical protein
VFLSPLSAIAPSKEFSLNAILPLILPTAELIIVDFCILSTFI